MSIAVKVLITYAVGASCGWLLYKIKVPGGFMIGAMIGAALLALFTELSYMHYIGKVAAQICAGAYIASSFRLGDPRHLLRVLRPALLVISLQFALNIVLGRLLLHYTALDAVTAYMATMPGGMSDVPIIAADLGGNGAVITVFQFARLVICMAVLPLLASALTTKEAQEYDNAPEEKSVSHASPLNLALTLAVGTLGGLCGLWLHVPVGALLFSLLFTLLLNIFFHRAYMPRPVRLATQVLSGSYVGCTVSMADVLLLFTSLPSVLIIVGGYTVGCIGIGWLLHKLCRMTLREGVLVATPIGPADSAMIAADMHLPMTDVAFIQIIRLIMVVAVFPQVLRILFF